MRMVQRHGPSRLATSPGHNESLIPDACELWARVELLLDLAEASGIHMGVDLRCSDVGVAEKFLHDAEIRATG